MAAQLLTARNVEGMKPLPGRVRSVRDKLTGLELRIGPAEKGGKKRWSIRYRNRAGVQRRWKIGEFPAMSLGAAREEAKRVLREKIWRGIDPHAEREAEKRRQEVEARRLTFGSLAQIYIEQHASLRKRTWKTDKRYLESECKAWKARLAADVTRRDVRGLIEAIAARPAPIMANRVLEVVRKVFNFAIDKEIVEVNPAMRCAKPGVERSRDRVLSDDEIRQFWAACDKLDARMAAGFKLRLVTAQRGGEVFNMRWQDVDLDGGWWTIPAAQSKNKLAHRVPLSSLAIDILKPLCAKEGETLDSPYVLAGARGIRQRTAAAKTFGLADFIGHDLRRTAATRMGSAGVMRFVLARVLNHVDTGITSVYDRATYDAEKRAALEKWEQALRAILSAAK